MNFSIDTGKESHHERGAITVFTSISLLIIITLTAMLVDGARIRTSEAVMGRTTANSLHSVLSYYDETLKEEYGLFALAMDEGEVEGLLMGYLEKGINPSDLAIDLEQFWDLYRFQIEAVEATTLHSLGEDEVLQQQILDFMKYRAPYELLQEVVLKLQEVSKIGETSKLIKEKTKIEKKLSDLAYLEKEMEEAIAIASNFNLQSFIATGDSIKGNISNHISYQKSKSELDRLYGELSLRILYMSEGEEKEALKRNADALLWDIMGLENAINEINRQLNNGVEDQIKILENLISSNSKIKTIGANLERKTENIIGQLVELKEKAKDLNTSEARGIMEEVEKYLKATEDHTIGNLVEIADKNLLKLNEASPAMKEANSILKRARGSLTSHQETINSHVDNAKTAMMGYNGGLAYNKWQMAGIDLGKATEADNRKETAKDATSLIDGVTAQDKVIPPHLQELLPSRGRGGLQQEVAIDFHHENKEMSFNETTLDLMEEISSTTSNWGINIRDELYINEYILGHFKSHVTEVEGFQYNLRNRLKSHTSSFFDSEIEYILYGKPSQNQNMKAIKMDLIMLRFVVNLIYVINNPRLVKEATILATAIAAPIGGAAMPFIKTMILSGWAMGYGIEDVRNLLKGEAVSFYRGQEQLKLHYQDYLRILLLKPSLTSSLKLDRIKDLIQLNLQQNPIYGEGYLIHRSKTYIQAEVQYSMKVLFIEQMRSNGNYQIQLWRGY